PAPERAPGAPSRWAAPHACAADRWASRTRPTCCTTSTRPCKAVCAEPRPRGGCCNLQVPVMLIQIAEVFTKEEAADIRARLEAAEWVDGRVTAGHQSAQVKRNRQLSEQHPLARELGALILQRLSANNLFMSAALPHRIFPPLFNRYEGGEAFGYHVDNAVRVVPGSGERVRTDLSATLFFSEPDSYDGGELVVDDTYGP